MQQIRNRLKNKSAQKSNAFVSVNSAWCAIADVKITFLDDPESDIEALRGLLGETTKEASEYPQHGDEAQE